MLLLYMNITPATYMGKQKKKGIKRNPWLFPVFPAWLQSPGQAI